MAEFSDYYEQKIIDHMLRGQAFTPPGTIYVALFTADTQLESNNPTAEVSGGAYARQTLALGTPVAGTCSNSGTITFPTATANWGTVSHAAVVDHVSNVTWGTNVNVLMWSPLDASKIIETNDIFQINAQALGISVA